MGNHGKETGGTLDLRVPSGDDAAPPWWSLSQPTAYLAEILPFTAEAPLCRAKAWAGQHLFIYLR